MQKKSKKKNLLFLSNHFRCLKFWFETIWELTKKQQVNEPEITTIQVEIGNIFFFFIIRQTKLAMKISKKKEEWKNEWKIAERLRTRLNRDVLLLLWTSMMLNDGRCSEWSDRLIYGSKIDPFDANTKSNCWEKFSLIIYPCFEFSIRISKK